MYSLIQDISRGLVHEKLNKDWVARKAGKEKSADILRLRH